MNKGKISIPQKEKSSEPPSPQAKTCAKQLWTAPVYGAATQHCSWWYGLLIIPKRGQNNQIGLP